MQIKGVNLGGWLLMEGYILGGRNIAESAFKRQFKNIYGEKELRLFESLFRDNFICEKDFEYIAKMGATALRLPFNYRLIASKVAEGLLYLEKALSWAERYNLKVILDLHAAVGSQNCDWHSDSSGLALLWIKQRYRQQTYALWEVIAEQLKDKPSLLGYDILNEPVLKDDKVNVLREFYQEIIKRIRAVDKMHTIFLEGNKWAQEINFLKDLISENISISIHTYAPLDYTFNFTSFYHYPAQIGDGFWDKDTLRRYLEPYFIFTQQNKVRIFVGEFGINWRGGFFGELEYLEDMLTLFEEFNFDYSYWTYKAVANHVFPDGLYQAVANNKYISRDANVTGWETYLSLWKNEKDNIVNFWRTENFTPNEKLISLLKKFFVR